MSNFHRWWENRKGNGPGRVLTVFIMGLAIATIAQSAFLQSQRAEDSGLNAERDTTNTQSIEELRRQYQDSQDALSALIEDVLAAETPEEVDQLLTQFVEENPGTPVPTVPAFPSSQILPPSTTQAPTTTGAPRPTASPPQSTSAGAMGTTGGAAGTTSSPAPAPSSAPVTSAPVPTAAPTTLPPVLQLPGETCLVILLGICIG